MPRCSRLAGRGMQIDFEIDQMRIDAVKRVLRDWSFRKLLWSWLPMLPQASLALGVNGG
jgi:hypothetical protein